MPARLPRTVESDPRHDAVRATLARTAALGPLRVPHVPLTDALVAALGAAARTGRLVRGLEAVVAALDAEHRGLVAAGLATGARVARLLLVTTDGSERFYRQVARAVEAHGGDGGRLLVVAVASDAASFGVRVFGGDATAKAVGVSHKDAVADVLFALANEG